MDRLVCVSNLLIVLIFIDNWGNPMNFQIWLYDVKIEIEQPPFVKTCSDPRETPNKKREKIVCSDDCCTEYLSYIIEGRSNDFSRKFPMKNTKYFLLFYQINHNCYLHSKKLCTTNRRLQLPELLPPLNRSGWHDFNGGVFGQKQCHRKKITGSEKVRWCQRLPKCPVMKVEWPKWDTNTR